MGAGATIEQRVRLEFTCRPDERSEAESLMLRHQLGGGSNWLTLLVLLAVLAGAIVFLWFAVINRIPAPYRPLVVAGVVALWVFFFFRERLRKRKQASLPTIVELSEEGMQMTGGQARALLPWKSVVRCIESESIFLLQCDPQRTCYILPKRAFPSKESMDWLRKRAANIDDVLFSDIGDKKDAASLASKVEPDATGISIQYRLGFRNYVDRTLASWFGRLVALGWAGMLTGVSIYSSFQPHPDAIYSSLQVFAWFVIPAMVIGAAFLLLAVSAHSWLGHKQRFVQTTVSLSDAHLIINSADGSFTSPWTAFINFKETRWSFIVWNRASGAWLLLPKSAFVPGPDLEHCRELLATHLVPSTWFYGM